MGIGEVQSWNDDTNEANWLRTLFSRKSAKVERHQTDNTQMQN